MKGLKTLTPMEILKVHQQIEKVGALTPDEESQFAEFLDELIDFTKFSGWLFKGVEMLDGRIFVGLITYLDDKFVDKLTIPLKNTISLLVQGVIAKDVMQVENTASYLLNELIDIPNIDEDAEGYFAKGLITTLIELVLKKVKTQ